ncbi:putative nucleotidyltransferase [Sulfolobales Beppu virus 1]|nr:putative nucleotidyltransferase [Sulfolobales Beppu virus 1]
MHAVILAGGFGKRLFPLTQEKPKPLIEINGKPILEWQIEYLKQFGIESFYVLAGYKKEVLIEWVSKNQERLNVSIAILTEEEPLGTGGALKRLKNFINDEFIAMNGDILTNIDIRRLTLENPYIVAISLIPLRSSFGVVKLEGEKIISFEEKPILKEYWMNAGIYKMKPDIFEYLPDKGDIEKTTFPLLAQTGNIKGVKFDPCIWISIDSIKDLEMAQEITKSPGWLKVPME